MSLKDELKKFTLYSGASVVAMLVDLVLFILFAEIIFSKIDDGISILAATVIARITSSTINFILSKKAFNSKDLKKTAIIKYFALILCQLLLSAGIVIMIHKFIKISKTVIKCIVDTILYLVFYKINSTFVFENR